MFVYTKSIIHIYIHIHIIIITIVIIIIIIIIIIITSIIIIIIIGIIIIIWSCMCVYIYTYNYIYIYYVFSTGLSPYSYNPAMKFHKSARSSKATHMDYRTSDKPATSTAVLVARSRDVTWINLI